MNGKVVMERELKKAKNELFAVHNLKDMKFIQRKIAYLQSRMREGI